MQCAGGSFGVWQTTTLQNLALLNTLYYFAAVRAEQTEQQDILGIYCPTMKVNATNEKRNPASPWLSMPILQLVSGQQKSIYISAQGTIPGPEGKEQRKDVMHLGEEIHLHMQ